MTGVNKSTDSQMMRACIDVLGQKHSVPLVWLSVACESTCAQALIEFLRTPSSVGPCDQIVVHVILHYRELVFLRVEVLADTMGGVMLSDIPEVFTHLFTHRKHKKR